jgi:O-antigen/teichoic acid export membrane protein
MIQLFLSSIIKIILVLVKADLIWFVFVTLFDSISLSVFSWWIYKSQGLPNFIKYFNWKAGKKLLKDSWPLVFSSIAIAVYMRIDQVMIKNMLGDREVGLYSAAVKVVEVWYFIPMIITQSVFPAIVNAKKANEKLYYKRLQQLFSLLIWTAILIAIPISVFSHQIIYFLYGEKFIETGKVLAISIWASLFVFIGVGSSKFFLVENLQKLSFGRTFYGMIVNIILNLILIPSHGIQGAAIATLISQAIAAYLFDIFNKETKKIFFMKTYASIPFRIYKCF